MIFTENWTKKDNDFHRSLIKEHKSVNEIIKIMGMEKLKYHPKGRFLSPNMSDSVICEIEKSRKNTPFLSRIMNILKSNKKLNHHAEFFTESKNKYIVDFIYIKETIGPYKNKDCYNLSFTISGQYDLSNSFIYNKTTNKNELFEVLSKLLFVVGTVCKKCNIKTLIVRLTEDDIKNHPKYPWDWNYIIANTFALDQESYEIRYRVQHVIHEYITDYQYDTTNTHLILHNDYLTRHILNYL